MIDDVQQVALTLKVMILPGDILQRQELFPSLELSLLAFDPRQLRGYGLANSFVVKAARRGDSHSAVGWINSEVHVFDVLTGHIYEDIFDFDLLHLGVHAVFIPD